MTNHSTSQNNLLKIFQHLKTLSTPQHLNNLKKSSKISRLCRISEIFINLESLAKFQNPYSFKFKNLPNSNTIYQNLKNLQKSEMSLNSQKISRCSKLCENLKKSAKISKSKPSKSEIFPNLKNLPKSLKFPKSSKISEILQNLKYPSKSQKIF